MTKSAKTNMAVGFSLSGLILVGWVTADFVLDGWRDAVQSGVIFALALGAAHFSWRKDSESAGLLISHPKDERQEKISQRAGDVTGRVACLVTVGGYIVSAICGNHAQAQAFGLMASICGGTLILSTIFISRRS